MNPLTNMKNVIKLSEQELYTTNKTSWHDQYRDSAWIFVGGLPYDLTEGDTVCIFSQYGEIVNINLIRDKDSGKSKGFCFLCYEDQRSTDLAVDNFNGIKILGRIIRVDHVTNYKIPKQGKKTDEETKKLYDEGCAPKPHPVQPIIEPVKVKVNPDDFRETLADQIAADIKLPARLPIYQIKKEKLSDEETIAEKESTEKKHKKDKKKRKKKKKKKSKKADSSGSESNSDDSEVSEDKKRRKKKKKRKSDSSSESGEEKTKKDKSKVDNEFKDQLSSYKRSRSCSDERSGKRKTEWRRSRSPNRRNR